MRSQQLRRPTSAIVSVLQTFKGLKKNQMVPEEVPYICHTGSLFSFLKTMCDQIYMMEELESGRPAGIAAFLRLHGGHCQPAGYISAGHGRGDEGGRVYLMIRMILNEHLQRN